MDSFGRPFEAGPTFYTDHAVRMRRAGGERACLGLGELHELIAHAATSCSGSTLSASRIAIARRIASKPLKA